MRNTNTGGPAFPCDLTMYDQEVVDAMQGMTLRDYFAAKAMRACIAKGAPLVFDAVADKAYEMADAMLKAREE